MKVFSSWSGDVSHTVALSLRDWLPSVLQIAEPYVSSEDIEKGARWSTEIGTQLEETSFGILCITPDNVSAPWLNFEAGALSKSLDTSRVSPFLLSIRPAELTGPLAQFQATLPQVDDVIRLVKSMNTVSERPIDEARITDATKTWWPRLEERLNAARRTSPGLQEPHRNPNEMIEELLEISRGLQRQLVRSEVEQSGSIRTRPYLPQLLVARHARRLILIVSKLLTEESPETSWHIVEKDGVIGVRFNNVSNPDVVHAVTAMIGQSVLPVDFHFPDFDLLTKGDYQPSE